MNLDLKFEVLLCNQFSAKVRVERIIILFLSPIWDLDLRLNSVSYWIERIYN